MSETITHSSPADAALAAARVQRRRAIARWAPVVLLAVAVGAVYSNSFAGPFVFDDLDAIRDNNSIRSLLPITKHLNNLRPIVELTLAINYAIGQLNPIGYHIFNFIVHLGAVLALYGLIRRTLRFGIWRERIDAKAATWLAFAIALVWGVHPLNTQAVTYIIQRAESMMSLFYLLTLYCVVRVAEATSTDSENTTSTTLSSDAPGDDSATGGGYETVSDTVAHTGAVAQPRSIFGAEAAEAQGQPVNKAAIVWTVLAFLCCTLAMGSKQVAASAPIMALLFDWVFLRDRDGRSGLGRRWAAHVTIFATYGYLFWLLGGGRMLVAEEGSAGFAIKSRDITPGSYFSAQTAVIYHYVRLVLAPYMQSFDYQWTYVPKGIELWLRIAGLTVAGVIGALGVIFRKWWGWAIIAFFFVLGPTSSFVPILDRAVEHRMYLPSAMVITLVAGLVFYILAKLNGTRTRGEAKKGTETDDSDDAEATAAVGGPSPLRGGLAAPFWLGVVLIAVVAGPLAYLAHVRNRIYHTDVALWQSVIKANPWYGFDAFRAYNNLGMSYFRLDDDLRAIEEFRNAVRQNDNFFLSHRNMGLALLNQGRSKEAIGAFEKAVRQRDAVPSRESVTYWGLATAYRNEGNNEKAIKYYRESLKLNPDRIKSMHDLGVLLAEQGRYDDAVEQFRKVLQRDTTHTTARLNLAKAHEYWSNELRSKGKARQADRELETAARLYKEILAPPADEAATRRGMLQAASYHATLILAEAAAGATIDGDALFEARRDSWPKAADAARHFVEAHWRLGVIRARQGQYNEALQLMVDAAKLAPRDFEARKNLARILAEMNRHEEAAQSFAYVLRMKPDDVASVYEYGRVLATLDRPGEARAMFERAIKLDGRHLAAHGDLAWMLATHHDATVRDGRAAIDLAKKLVALAGENSPQALDTLAAAYAEVGLFEDAARTVKQAVAAAEQHGRADLLDAMQRRLKLYEQGKPFHREAPTEAAAGDGASED